MIFVHPKSLQNAYSTKLKSMNALMTFVYPKSLQNDLKIVQNAYSTSSSHASTVLSVLHDHLCKILIAALPDIGFFAYRMRQQLQQFSFSLRHKYCQFFWSSKKYQ